MRFSPLPAEPTRPDNGKTKMGIFAERAESLLTIDVPPPLVIQPRETTHVFHHQDTKNREYETGIMPTHRYSILYTKDGIRQSRTVHYQTEDASGRIAHMTTIQEFGTNGQTLLRECELADSAAPHIPQSCAEFDENGRLIELNVTPPVGCDPEPYIEAYAAFLTTRQNKALPAIVAEKIANLIS